MLREKKTNETAARERAAVSFVLRMCAGRAASVHPIFISVCNPCRSRVHYSAGESGSAASSSASAAFASFDAAFFFTFRSIFRIFFL